MLSLSSIAGTLFGVDRRNGPELKHLRCAGAAESPCVRARTSDRRTLGAGSPPARLPAVFERFISRPRGIQHVEELDAGAYVGYADTLRAPPFVPSPWAGDPGVTFVGTDAPWDAGAVRLDNPSKNPLTVDDVSVEIGAVSIDLWGPYPIIVPGKSRLILTQTDFFNFDTSDVVAGPCDSPSTVIPVVHVTVGSHMRTKSFRDVGQVLITAGIDPAVCTGANEGHAWQRITQGRGSRDPKPGKGKASHRH
jgi:hypothetical protein